MAAPFVNAHPRGVELAVSLSDDQVGSADDPSVQAVAEAALDLIPDGSRVGLGTGRAVAAFIARLGELQSRGLRIVGVATSQDSANRARQAGIPLLELAAGMPLDITIDGADEVAPNLDLIKGWGGALVRERIVAAASNRQVIVVGMHKLVRRLGERGQIPVEVIPFAKALLMREAPGLGLLPTLRMNQEGHPFISENGNLIVDCAPEEPLGDAAAARELEGALRAIPGVVDTGLFLGTAERVLVGYPDGRVDSLLRSGT